MKSIHLCCLIVLSVFLPHQSHSQGEAAVPFLRIHPSPEANGRGNTGAVIVSDNPIATIANPAQLGIFSLRNYFSASIYAPKSDWLPTFGVTDLTYNVLAINAGYNLAKELPLPFPISIGAGYSRIDLNRGRFIRTDQNGREIGRFDAFENSDNISVAVGADYFVKVGIGWNFKAYDRYSDPSAQRTFKPK